MESHLLESMVTTAGPLARNFSSKCMLARSSVAPTGKLNIVPVVVVLVAFVDVDVHHGDVVVVVGSVEPSRDNADVVVSGSSFAASRLTGTTTVTCATCFVVCGRCDVCTCFVVVDFFHHGLAVLAHHGVVVDCFHHGLAVLAHHGVVVGCFHHGRAVVHLCSSVVVVAVLVVG